MKNIELLLDSTYNLLNIDEICDIIIKNIESSKSTLGANICPVLRLHGALGVGKTTLVKGIINRIFENIDKKNKPMTIPSPTFTIVNTYPISWYTIDNIHHFDLYRLKNVSELEAFDWGFYLSRSLILSEWPEIAKDILNTYAAPSIDIYLDYHPHYNSYDKMPCSNESDGNSLDKDYMRRIKIYIDRTRQDR